MNRNFHMYKILTAEEAEILEQQKRAITLYSARQKARERRKSLVQNQVLGLALFISGIFATCLFYRMDLEMTAPAVCMGLGLAVAIVATYDIHSIDKIYVRR